MVANTTECRTCGGTVALTMSEPRDKCPHCGEKGPATTAEHVEKQNKENLMLVLGIVLLPAIMGFIAFKFF
jgi:predicted RNA-binding Zn-ribbon protein involved in translation (DUF1610 family)